MLQLAGLPPEARAELYDFIVAEMESLALKHPHRIDDIVTSLKSRREALTGKAQKPWLEMLGFMPWYKQAA